MVEPQIAPSEHRAYLLTIGAVDEADALAAIQHREGYAAFVRGEELQNFRPAAWQTGWLDAYEDGYASTIIFSRMDAEI